ENAYATLRVYDNCECFINESKRSKKNAVNICLCDVDTLATVISKVWNSDACAGGHRLTPPQKTIFAFALPLTSS
ncbi:unnamed protein product, partial [Amoebophrya sp. A25]